MKRIVIGGILLVGGTFAPPVGGAAGLGAIHTNNIRLAPVRRQALGSKREDGVFRLEGTA